MPKAGERLRVMLLALVYLRKLEREGGIRHPDVVRQLSEALGFTERQARNVLVWLREEGFIAPAANTKATLKVTGWVLTEKARQELARLGVP